MALRQLPLEKIDRTLEAEFINPIHIARFLYEKFLHLNKMKAALYTLSVTFRIFALPSVSNKFFGSPNLLIPARKITLVL